MANTLYDSARQGFLEAQINWLTDTMKVYLVDAGAYTPNTQTHQFLADINISSRIAGPAPPGRAGSRARGGRRGTGG